MVLIIKITLIKVLIIKITLIKVLNLYIFDDFYWKKMLDIDV